MDSKQLDISGGLVITLFFLIIATGGAVFGLNGTLWTALVSVTWITIAVLISFFDETDD